LAVERLSVVLVVAAMACGGCSSANLAVGPAPQSANGADTGAGADAAAPGTRSEAVVPGRPARVFIFAGVDKSCASLPAPELQIVTPPAKGDVSFRPGQDTTMAASLSGYCTGAKAKGTGVYYTARDGTSGTDTFAVTARLQSGEEMRREFQVKIAE
jgi:hypothetical protein